MNNKAPTITGAKGSSGLGRSTGESFPILYTSKTKTAGGSEVTATQNIPFELIRPSIQSMTVPGTNISAQMRTISGASLDGTETPFIDQGFEDVTLGENNVVSTPRIIASRVNETNNLSTLPGNKSLQMRLNLTTASSKISPVIDSQRMSAFFVLVGCIVKVITTQNLQEIVMVDIIAREEIQIQLQPQE